jgi:beta-glucosidase
MSFSSPVIPEGGTTMSFPDGFVWGAATASYQIEGAVSEDGRGPSVWDTFCRRPGAIWNGQNGDVACDHYHRHAEDVAIMKEIGLKGYRFSICWPRVLPSGTGAVNQKGLGFYDKLVDELLDADVQPWPTLFHWDFPQALFERGGWLNRDSADWFADYVRVVVDRLSDRVCNWFTLNEPQCFIGFGHRDGINAPGLKLSRAEVLLAGHHALLAHGKGVQVIRSASKRECRIGYAPVGWSKIPACDSPEDVDAARKVTFAVTDDEPIVNTWWMDPVYFGTYPEDGLALYGQDAPSVGPADMETISQPLDFQAFNTYNGILVRSGAGGASECVPHPTGYAMTFFYGAVTPEALYWTPKFMYERYKLPVVMSENGMSNADWLSVDGKVHDPQRIDYLQRYLLAFERAADEGVEVAGYFLWSLLDNFEWSHGYKQRFGIVYVDFPTGQRTLKDSAFWYRDVIASNGGALHPEAE